MKALYALLKFVALFLIIFIIMAILSIPFIIKGDIAIEGDTFSSSMIPLFIIQNIAMVIASLLMWKWFERAKLSEIGLKDNRLSLNFLRGSGLGVVLFAMIFLLFFILGLQSTEINPEDASASQLFLSLLYLLFSFMIVAVGEEILSRGYMQGVLKAYFNPVVAIVTTSLIFGLMHIANSHFSYFAFINITLVGVLLGLAREISGSLYLPIGIHFTWNLTQSFLGYPVSGNMFDTPLLLTRENGPDWLTGGSFGPEAGLAASAVSLLGIWYIRRMKKAHKA